MKEIMAIIRSDKIGKTKQALNDAGFPAYTCRKVMGRGKDLVDPKFFRLGIEEGELTQTPVGEYIASASRLIPKRVITMIVCDEDVVTIIDTLMNVNSEGNAGDGKIFVLPICEALRIRNGEYQEDSETY